MNICQNINELTAWPCSVVKGALGENVTMLAPPVHFWDGSIVPVYLFDHNGQIEITDDGGVLEHLDVSGFNLIGDKRRRIGLQKAVAGWNANFDTDLVVWCKPDAIAQGLQRYLGALFTVANWEMQNAGKPADDALLIAETEMYLHALNPNAHFQHDIGLLGISGKSLTFPIQVDATFYDAVGAHHASSAAKVKKLFDVRSVPDNRDLDITVVVDDRASSTAKQTKADIQVLSQLAHVERFMDLQSRAKSVLTLQ